ncbi:putative ankyrin repeat protein RF_0381 [Aphidius gifuensis]|uniref:putative ankyrin repeat protein RF_0381 n=1 Tax=Aphidius gifuensis TaxID=684658 RepID=UPI001CDB7235|nr:putative ankyrin repeat protein RF_0381 [Aphidius gifuensis]
MSLIQLACKKSSSEIVKLLIDYGADVNYVDPSLQERYTCLHMAVESQDKCKIQLLVNEGSFINATAENNITPLHIAAKKRYNNLYPHDKNNLLKILLENGADVNAQTNDKKTALYFAAQAGHLSAVQTILEHHPDKNIESDSSSVGVAISCDHTNEMKASYFTSQAQHMDMLNDYGLSKLVKNIRSNINSHYANMSCDHSIIVNLLIDYGLTLEPQHKYYKMFIFAAASIGHLKIIENFLTSDSCDVNLSVDPSSKNSTRILHTSIINNHTDISVLLIKHGADVNVKDKNNKSPVYYAVTNNNTEITKKLVAYHAEVQSIFLNCAIRNDNLEIIKILVRCGVDINTIFDIPVSLSRNRKLTPLLIAMEKKNDSVIQYLVEHGANVNFFDAPDGVPPLHYAVENKNEKIVNMLLNAGANINLKYGKDNRTVLCSAAQTIGDIEMIKLLLEKGANVNCQDKSGMTPLHHIISQKRFDFQMTFEIIELLLKYNADINCKSKSVNAVTNNNTEATKKLVPYHAEVQPILLNCAIHNDNLDIIKILVRCGVDVNTIFDRPVSLSYLTPFSLPRNKKLTPLLMAMEKTNDSVIQYLVEHGANVNFFDAPDGVPPLHYAVENKNEKIVNMLLNAGANINLKYGKDNRTVLCSAAQTIGDIEMIKLLLEKGANVNCQDKSGMTPLIHYATINTEYDKKDDTRIIELLLKFGANIDYTDQLGNTALGYAMYKRNEKSFRTLLDNGADINIMMKPNEEGKYEGLYEIATSFYEKDGDLPSSGFNLIEFNKTRRPDEIIIEMLREHIIQLKQAKCWINEGNLRAINSSEDSSKSSDMLDLCNKEISNMKIEKIGDSCVTFHDVLINDFNKFEKNKYVIEILELEQYKKSYPIYGKIITGNYRKAKFKITMKRDFIDSFYCQCHRFNKLPYICVEKICNYLTLEDMNKVINLIF